jgi:lysozyme
MQLSEEGLAFLKECEGVRYHPYFDVAGLETTGCGHLCTDEERASGLIQCGDTAVPYRARPLTDAEVDALLRQDVAHAEAVVTQAVEVELTQAQFSALVSLVYNIGAHAFRQSTLCRLLNAGDFAAIPDQFRRWTRAGGQVIRGLQVRRQREIDHWHGETTLA